MYGGDLLVLNSKDKEVGRYYCTCRVKNLSRIIEFMSNSIEHNCEVLDDSSKPIKTRRSFLVWTDRLSGGEDLEVGGWNNPG